MSQPTQLQYRYDAQGNMLSDGNRQFTYDAMNRLYEVKNADGSFQKNRYDGEGLRTELEENGRLVSFIFDGDKVVSEKDDENTIRYIRGYELISSDSEKARTYYHYTSDEMGSITHVTDEAGSVLNRYEYDAFGECIIKNNSAIHWGYVTKPKRLVDVNKPRLVGFRGNGSVFPYSLVSVCTRRSLKKWNDKDLFEIYQKWCELI